MPDLGSLRRAFVAAACVVSLALIAPAASFAAPPSPQLLERAKHDPVLQNTIDRSSAAEKSAGIDRPTTSAEILNSRISAMLIGSSSVSLLGGVDPAPTLGVYRQLVLLVDFSDRPHATAATFYDDLMFKDTVGPSSVRGFYREVSASALDIQPVANDLPSRVGWLRMPQPYTYYCGTSNGRGTYPNNSQKLAEDAMAAAEAAGVDFSAYDNNHDGTVDGLVLIHSGSGAEMTGASTDIWSHKWGVYQSKVYDAVRTSSYTTEPEYWMASGDMTTGVFCHELGHVFGLPDLYDTDNSSRGIGRWSLMAYGSWNGNLGASPARPDAWCQTKLGFATAQQFTGSPRGVTIHSATASNTGDIYRVEKAGVTGGQQYFMIENRQLTGTDAGLPGSGLLIWHVDESVAGNTNEAHFKVDLEEAHGGAQHLQSLANSGDSGDPFPGVYAKTVFSDLTDPSSTYYDGSGRISVDHVTASSSSMDAVIAIDRTALATDTVPPHTTSDAATDYNDLATISLAATDTGYGVATTSWTLDGASGQGSTVRVTTVGAHTLRFWSVDVAGNVETPTVASFTVHDTRAPSVSSDAVPVYLSKAKINLTAADSAGGSGVSSVWYRLDGAATATVSAATCAVQTSVAGTHSVTFGARDVAGNVSESRTASFTVIVDLEPPTTTSDATATYTTSARISLTATDTGFGLAITKWLLDGVPGVGTTVNAPTYGAHTLVFWSVDLADNAEAPTTVHFFVRDVGIPTVTSNAQESYTDMALIDISAADEVNGSGAGYIASRLDGAATETVSVTSRTLMITTAGQHTLTFWTADRAGNFSAPSTVSFRVVGPTRFVLAASPSPMDSGRAVTLRARVDTVTAIGPTTGEPVQLQTLGGEWWSLADPTSALMAADGTFSFTVTPFRSALYRFMTAPGCALRSGQSDTFVVGVRGKVSTPTTPKSPRAKRTFSISGTVQPVPIRRARVEWYRVSGATKKLYSAQTVTLSSAGKWTIKRTLPKGSWAVRVVYTDSLKVVTNGGFRSFRVK